MAQQGNIACEQVQWLGNLNGAFAIMLHDTSASWRVAGMA